MRAPWRAGGGASECTTPRPRERLPRPSAQPCRAGGGARQTLPHPPCAWPHASGRRRARPFLALLQHPRSPWQSARHALRAAPLLACRLLGASRGAPILPPCLRRGAHASRPWAGSRGGRMEDDGTMRTRTHTHENTHTHHIHTHSLRRAWRQLETRANARPAIRKQFQIRAGSQPALGRTAASARPSPPMSLFFRRLVAPRRYRGAHAAGAKPPGRAARPTRLRWGCCRPPCGLWGASGRAKSRRVFTARPACPRALAFSCPEGVEARYGGRSKGRWRRWPASVIRTYRTSLWLGNQWR